MQRHCRVPQLFIAAAVFLANEAWSQGKRMDDGKCWRVVEWKTEMTDPDPMDDSTIPVLVTSGEATSGVGSKCQVFRAYSLTLHESEFGILVSLPEASYPGKPLRIRIDSNPPLTGTEVEPGSHGFLFSKELLAQLAAGNRFLAEYYTWPDDDARYLRLTYKDFQKALDLYETLEQGGLSK